MIDVLSSASTLLPVILTVVVSAIASADAILRKRDVRAAIGWVGLIWLVPLAGTALYFLFGINRIRRRASLLRLDRPHPAPAAADATDRRPSLAAILPAEARHLSAIGDLIDAVAPAPLTTGNAITALVGGEIAYREMLQAIDGASRTIGMATYIFDHDRAGKLFADALARAVARGIQVRVLVDAVGAKYSYPTASSRLRRLGVPLAEFLPTFVPLHMHYANLRNHRKILVVDGRVGFTGGMNIRGGYLNGTIGAPTVHDIHFRLEGPVVGHLAATFADDWAFCTREVLAGDGWFPTPVAAGTAAARGIAAGPDEDFERIRWAILGALSQAKRRIRILTPYFLPDHMLITSLVVAAMRGVEVEILLPRNSNLRLVQWASRAKISALLDRGCRIWQTPPPFDHSKLMTVDDAWSLIGSANWDQRSLRLNFELNVECYDTGVAAALDAIIDAKREAAQPLAAAEIKGRSLAVKLRDGTAWLFSPYL